MSSNGNDGDFYYIVSSTGEIQAFKRPPDMSDEDIEDLPRDAYVTGKAALGRAKQCLRSALEGASITEKNKLQQRLGRLEYEEDSVLSEIREAAS